MPSAAYYRTHTLACKGYNKVYAASHQAAINASDREYGRTPKRRFYLAGWVAKKRGLLWQITYDEWFSVQKNPCDYCGTSLVGVTGSSLDRVDSSKGYTLANVRPCCRLCNSMKRDMPLDVWLAKLRGILTRASR